MTTILTRAAITKNLAQGLGQVMPQYLTSVTGTAAAFNSGYFTAGMRVNLLGSTLPGTIVGMLSKDNATNQLLSVFNFVANNSAGRYTYLGRFYRIGGVVLTSTGNQFTHDAATFPLTRTVMGQTSNINLMPVVYVTTLTSTTAPQFVLKGSGSTTGYVNQVAANVIGTQTFVFPAAATAAGSAFVPMLENGDSGIQDVVQVDVTTASSAGACDIYGFEPLMFGGTNSSSVASVHNAAVGSMMFTDTKPAVATSGTVTSYFGYLSLTAEAASPYGGMNVVVNNQ